MNAEITLNDIMQAVFDNADLQAIVAELGSYLGHPCMVIDTGFRTLASSTDIADDSDMMGTVRGNRFLGLKYVETLRNSYFFSRIFDRGYMCQTIDADDKDQYIAASVATKSLEVYIFILFGEKGFFPQERFGDIKEICKILSVKLRVENPYHSLPALMPNYVLSDLLDANPAEGDKVMERLSHLEWLKEGPFFLAIIRCVKKDRSKRQLVPVICELDRWVPKSAIIQYGGGLVAFLTEKIYVKYVEEDTKGFEAFLNQYNMRCAVGPVYTDIMKSSYAYKLADAIYQAGDHYHQTLTLSGNMYDNLMAYLLEVHYGVNEYLHPAVHTLLAYDKENGTELFDTVEIYLHHKHELNVALELLHIQRSTLFYRVKKVRELTGIGLERLDDIIQIHFSIHLVKLYGKQFFLNGGRPEN